MSEGLGFESLRAHHSQLPPSGLGFVPSTPSSQDAGTLVSISTRLASATISRGFAFPASQEAMDGAFTPMTSANSRCPNPVIERAFLSRSANSKTGMIALYAPDISTLITEVWHTHANLCNTRSNSAGLNYMLDIRCISLLKFTACISMLTSRSGRLPNSLASRRTH